MRMKENIFNAYVDKVADLFSITRDQLFSKSKNRNLVDARHLLFFLCYKRPMTIRYIQDFMEKNGYKSGHSTIIYGIEQVATKVDSDPDYKTVIEDIQGA